MPRRPPKALSKSRFVSGCQCPKRLWTEARRPDLVPPPDPATRAIFERGHEVGRLATSLFPGGLEIGGGARRWDVVVEATRKALTQRRPLYEAAFLAGGGACRVDVLAPSGNGAWELVEVKSSGQVKEVHLLDAALQCHVLESAGIELSGCYLMHLDGSYVLEGELDPEALFKKVDIAAEVAERLPEVRRRLPELLAVAHSERRPEVPIGSHCHAPYECPLISECWGFLPADSVFTLRGLRRSTAFELIERGIEEATKIPADHHLDRRQRIQVEALSSGGPVVDLSALAGFLERLNPPYWFFDLETIMPAIPRFEGTSPFQAIPFQYSVHRVEGSGAVPKHLSFLAEGGGDPRAEFLERLEADLGGEGSILAYNASYERRILRETVTALPGDASWLEDIESRIVDLLEPFRTFAYYHPSQGGSASLKKVLPALTGAGYDSLDIGDGRIAGSEFERVTWGAVAESERAMVRSRLEEYCALDTSGMIAVVEALRRVVS